MNQQFLLLDVRMVNASEIKEHLVVQARNPGSTQGPFEIYIGMVDCVENGKYIKLTKNNALDGRHHWFPIEWVESVDEQAVYLNKTADRAMAELMDKHPT